MTETRTVAMCTHCGVLWDVDRDDAACVDADHDHQRFELHRHRTVVTLRDGTEIVAVSFDDTDPYARDRPPDFGLYLDPRWQPPWPHHILDWPDFGVPEDPAEVVTALRALRARARRGARVELGCHGGHGRTGTALACLAVLSGEPPEEAVAWVRAHYCDQAVETPEQAAFVAALET